MGHLGRSLAVLLLLLAGGLLVRNEWLGTLRHLAGAAKGLSVKVLLEFLAGSVVILAAEDLRVGLLQLLDDLLSVLELLQAGSQ